MYFDGILLGFILLYVLIGLMRYALRSFLSFIFFIIYLLAIVFFPESLQQYQNHYVSLLDFLKSVFAVSMIYLAGYFLLALTGSLISSLFYKSKKDKMSRSSKLLSRLISVFFSFLHGTTVSLVLVLMMILGLQYYGVESKLSDHWIKNSYALKYGIKLVDYIPKEYPQKFKRVNTILASLINSDVNKKIVECSSFKRLKSTDAFQEMIEKISEKQENGVSPDDMTSFISEDIFKRFFEDEEVYKIISSDNFFEELDDLLSKRKVYFKKMEKKKSDFKPDSILHLKNGNKVDCKIVYQNDFVVDVIVLYGDDEIPTKFYKKEIKKITDMR